MIAAQSALELQDALVAKYGGADALSVVHVELIVALVKLFAELRRAQAPDIPRLIDAIAHVEQMLPAPPASRLATIKDYAAARAAS
jgi:hypothetical protein